MSSHCGVEAAVGAKEERAAPNTLLRDGTGSEKAYDGRVGELNSKRWKDLLMPLAHRPVERDQVSGMET